VTSLTAVSLDEQVGPV